MMHYHSDGNLHEPDAGRFAHCHECQSMRYMYRAALDLDTKLNLAHGLADVIWQIDGITVEVEEDYVIAYTGDHRLAIVIEALLSRWYDRDWQYRAIHNPMVGEWIGADEEV